MPLSWNEIRQNAISFSREWIDETRENAEAQTFWNDFFEVFGVRRRTVASFEEPVRNLTGDFDFIDLFWPGTLLAEHKSRGRPLDKAESQAMRYIRALVDDDREQEVPQYIVVSDFARIALHDLESDRTVEFPLADLHEHISAFAFIAGYRTEILDPEDPANIDAARRLAALYDTLKGGGYPEHDVERFMVRLLFCMFAEDTGLFGQPDAFRLYIENSTRPDGSDLGIHLGRYFEILNTPRDRRQANLDEQLADLPYVNGDLFEQRLPSADFNRDMRNRLLACCRFRWARISPAVFGSLFQSIMEGPERRQIGAHYTSERDIMKLIKSLFLDELRAEFERAKNTSKPAVRRFREKLGSLKFLDPACGCGNFLVLAYRELRLLELEVLKILHRAKGVAEQATFDLRSELLVDVDQMHGIEILEWPVRIAEVAMWLMDHQMNLEVSEAFGQYVARLPLENSPRIACANALRIDWNEVLPAEECDYVLGNPPFVGKKERDPAQKADHQNIWRELRGSFPLDYVTCWYAVALTYMTGTSARAAFVSTNSISQGEQVGLLWPTLFRRGAKIDFAHRTFPWQSEARGKAHVHVVIIGFGHEDSQRPKVIHDYDGKGSALGAANVSNISPYLTDGPDRAVTNLTRPLCNVPPMRYGSMMIDKDRKASAEAGLILLPEYRTAILQESPELKPYIKRLYGGEEFLNNKERWCLWLVDAQPRLIRSNSTVRSRVDGVRRFRLSSSRERTRELAETPALFGEIRQPDSPYLLVPKVSSERREYIPIGFMPPDVIASGSTLIVPDATAYEFGILHSAMHMAWVRQVCGRMKSDYQYSARLVYNNYPWPDSPTDAQKQRIEQAAQAVLDARAQFPDATLADLYDPLSMPAALRRAHNALDRAVDRCYRRQPFPDERRRFEFLFERYERLTAPLTSLATRKRRARRR
ncbi:MAG: class I SAM-dependent DNA methyltransferase [Planctomycetes bacterium]|nr:class I SAM-dependent DNA methyltransferase [Planctomycetota bacterium]